MYEDLLRSQLTQLRLEKGVSARDMSLSLGQSESYINKIENGRALPSMESFFYICEYFGIHPRDFFSADRGALLEIDTLVRQIAALDEESIPHLRWLIERLSQREA